LEKAYVKTGKVLLAFRHFPLARRHVSAPAAAQAAICAQRQGRFWAMHDALFGDQGHLDDASLQERSRSLDLDGNQFKSCMTSFAASNQLADDVKSAKGLKIQGTPTFFIGQVLPNRHQLAVTAVIVGAKPLTAFDAVLGPLLK
jgi:protein-disulfide isomerase